MVSHDCAWPIEVTTTGGFVLGDASFLLHALSSRPIGNATHRIFINGDEKAKVDDDAVAQIKNEADEAESKPTEVHTL